VLDAGTRQSLVTVRSLGRKKLSIAAMETFRNAPAFSSRWCKARFVSSGGWGSDAYLHNLEKALDRTNAPLAIPSHDGTIALLRQHRERLERRVRIALARESAMAIAVNKSRTLAVAEELGIAVPSGVIVVSPDDIPGALEEIGLPAVVKPVESWVRADGDGARVAPRLVTTADEASRIFAELTRLGGAVLLQRLVTGRREAISLLYADGKVYARFAQWAQRTVPPLGGDSVLRQSIPVPADIGDQAESLVREINLEGYSEVEFRRDRVGIPYLMEINPRLSASVEVAVRSGVDFPFLLKQWASGEPIDKVERYRTGGWMRYLGGDIRGTIDTIRQRGRPGITPPARAVRDFFVAFLRPMGYDYFQWRDPVPALSASAGFLRHTAGQVLMRDASSLGRSSHGRRGTAEDSATVRARRAI
jgi:predicted ATP-grasp superfamily ATP-dependent carboligase